MAVVTCAECGTQEKYDLKPGFPRKYCSKCSAAKKAAYEGGQVVKSVEKQSIPEVPVSQPKAKGTNTPRNANEITATELIKEAVKLEQTNPDGWSKTSFVEALGAVVDGYEYFLRKLNEGHEIF